MDTNDIESSRKRAPNWPGEQHKRLVELYNEHKAVLDGKLSATITNLKKNDLWSKIADDVSSFGPDRTVEQCRKKIADSKSNTKAKAARIAFSVKLTGGGPKHTEELTPIEAMIVAKMPKVTYEGIKGGIDTHMPLDSGDSTAYEDELPELSMDDFLNQPSSPLVRAKTMTRPTNATITSANAADASWSSVEDFPHQTSSSMAQVTNTSSRSAVMSAAKKFASTVNWTASTTNPTPRALAGPEAHFANVASRTTMMSASKRPATATNLPESASSTSATASSSNQTARALTGTETAFLERTNGRTGCPDKKRPRIDKATLSNADQYMADMTTVGQQLVEVGQQLVEKLTSIADSTSQIADAAKLIASYLKED